jgi:spore coat protein U-like protein
MRLSSLRRTLLCLSLVVAASAAAPAMAGTTTGTFAVTANVINSCKVSSSTAIAFGNYDPANANAAAPLNSNGSVAVQCTKGDAVTITLDQGQNAASGSTCSAPARRMTASVSGTSYYLNYGIFTTAALASAWGCTSGTNSQSFTSATASTPTTLTTYGSVPAAQDLPAGAYSDTVTFTVTF